MSMEERSKKYLGVGIVWILLLGIGVFAWQYWLRPRQEHKLKQATGSTSQYKHDMCIMSDSFSGYAILRSKEFAEGLRVSGIKVTSHVDNANYVERLKKLRDGECAFAVFTVDSEIKAGANPEINDYPGTAVLVIDESFGADSALVNKHAVKRMEDIERIVYPVDSPGEFLARVLAFNFSLPNLSSRWVGVTGAAEVYKKLVLAGKDDKTAYVVWEPYITKALGGNADLYDILNSAKMKGFIVDVLLVQREYLEANPEIVLEVVENYLRVAYQYTKDPERLIQLIMKDAAQYGEPVSETEAREVVKKIRWKNTLENYAHFGVTARADAKGLEPMEDIYEKVAHVLVETGAVATNPIAGKVTTLYHDNILRQLERMQFHPERKINIVDDPNLKGDTEEIRGDMELKPLTPEGWEKLSVVGSMKAQPLSFQRGASTLTLESRRSLDEIAEHLSSWPEYYLTIVGHARALGDLQASMRLAERRATAVRDYLLEKGIKTERIRIQAEKPSGTEVENQVTSFVLGQLPY